MADTIAGTSPRNAAKVAGLMFLLNLTVPLLNWTFVLSSLVAAGNFLATANNIMAEESQFRFGITVELIMSVGLIVLGLALYVILEPVNRNLALLALLLKFLEAATAAAIVLVSFIALQVAGGAADALVVPPEHLLAPLGIVFSRHFAIYSIPMVFLGLDMMIFSYLFLKSKYIPGILSCLGILSFALIFIHALMFILAPGFAALPVSQLIFWAPSGLFEIIIGIWLLAKGVKVP